jgi:transcriptional regulator with XRE-family HTH domain
MTQAALAGKLQLAEWDIDRAGVSKIEMGIRKVTDIELVTLAKVLQVPPLWLLGEETTQEAPALTDRIATLLTDMGSDFALIGRQYPISVDAQEYTIDLLYYHRILKALIAIEVQAGEFKPVYTEKMRFYLAALDDGERKPGEDPSIGITICSTEDRTTVQYTLKEMGPSGDIGTYRHYSKLADLPDMIAPYLPSEAEIYSRLVD